MAYIVIEINSSNYSIADLNAKSANGTLNAQQAVNGLQNLLNGIAGGASDGTVKIVVKDAATTINTSGTGSTTVTYDLS